MLRVVGTVVMIFGLQLIMLPFMALLRVMPTVRRFFERGRGFVALRLGLVPVIACAFLWVADHGLVDETVAQHVATAAVVIFLTWLASRLRRGWRAICQTALGGHAVTRRPAANAGRDALTITS